MIIDYSIAGIPCQIKVTNHYSSKSSIHPQSCETDEDFYGVDDFEYIVLDRTGYRAKWLETKIDSKVNTKIIHELQRNHQ